MKSGYDIRTWAKQQVVTLSGLRNFLRDRKSALLIAIVVALTLLFFSSYIKMLLIMIFFIAVGVISLLYNRFLKISLGIELNLMGVVITGFLYGPIAAFVVGSVTLFFAFVLTEHLTHASVVSFIGVAVISFLIPAFASFGITTTGILLTIIFDIIIGVGYLILGSRVERTALFIATHIPFNIWVFWSLAPRVYGFLS